MAERTVAGGSYAVVKAFSFSSDSAWVATHRAGDKVSWFDVGDMDGAAQFDSEPAVLDVAFMDEQTLVVATTDGLVGLVAA